MPFHEYALSVNVPVMWSSSVSFTVSVIWIAAAGVSRRPVPVQPRGKWLSWYLFGSDLLPHAEAEIAGDPAHAHRNSGSRCRRNAIGRNRSPPPPHLARPTGSATCRRYPPRRASPHHRQSAGIVPPPLVDSTADRSVGDACVEGFQAFGLSSGGAKPHPACALFTIEKPATLSTSAASKGRIEIFMVLPLSMVGPTINDRGEGNLASGVLKMLW